MLTSIIEHCRKWWEEVQKQGRYNQEVSRIESEMKGIPRYQGSLEEFCSGAGTKAVLIDLVSLRKEVEPLYGRQAYPRGSYSQLDRFLIVASGSCMNLVTPATPKIDTAGWSGEFTPMIVRLYREKPIAFVGVRIEESGSWVPLGDRLRYSHHYQISGIPIKKTS